MIEDHPHTLLELEQRFRDELACREYLFALRWPQGFVCPACSGPGTAVRRDLWRCDCCGRETSVMAGTVFQDTKLPLTIWFRTMWQVTSQKNGISAPGLQRVLGPGSYKTAWAMLHKLRRAMVRPGQERFGGVVEVDEAYWGGEESGVRGRQTEEKALIAVAAEAAGENIGRVRLQHIPNTDRATLHGFIQQSIEPGSTVVTDDLQAYRELEGYVHDRQIQKYQPSEADHLLPRAHRVISLLKRWLLGTHQRASRKNTYMIISTNLRSVSTGALPPRVENCSTAWHSRLCRSRQRHSTRSRNTSRSTVWTHVNTPVVLRERETIVGPDGVRTKAYAFADGHS